MAGRLPMSPRKHWLYGVETLPIRNELWARPQSIVICMKITCVVEGLEQIESSEPEDIAREVAED
jgi:hypothetical protein